MLHNLTIGHLDTAAIQQDRRSVVLKPLPMEITFRVLAESGTRDSQGRWRLGGGKVEPRDGYLLIPCMGHGTTHLREEFPLRIKGETRCVLSDREHSRIIEPEELRGMNVRAIEAGGTGIG